MVVETDGKPTNEYEYKEGIKPVYIKKLQAASPHVDALKREPGCCAVCNRWCVCCIS